MLGIILPFYNTECLKLGFSETWWFGSLQGDPQSIRITSGKKPLDGRDITNFAKNLGGKKRESQEESQEDTPR